VGYGLRWDPDELAHMERLRACAMISSTDVLAPAAEPPFLCAWSCLVLGQLVLLRLANKIRTSR
jgi:hypothetical protein